MSNGYFKQITEFSIKSYRCIFLVKKEKNKVRMVCRNIYSLRIILRCKRDIVQKGQTIKKVLQ
jgi:hypothetical protein